MSTWEYENDFAALHWIYSETTAENDTFCETVFYLAENNVPEIFVENTIATIKLCFAQGYCYIRYRLTRTHVDFSRKNFDHST